VREQDIESRFHFEVCEIQAQGFDRQRCTPSKPAAQFKRCLAPVNDDDAAIRVNSPGDDSQQTCVRASGN